jgi:RNA polymerase sigma factor (sigma-70 family)
MCDQGDRANPAERPCEAATPELLGQLLDRHGAALELYARQWCCTPEDVVQQAFVQLARQRPVPEQLATWLYRVVRNGAISASRSERRRRRHEASAAELTRSWFMPSGCGELESGLDGGAATEALAGLAQDEREIIVAHRWGGLTFQEIGTVAGLSASTAHRRYVSGLQSLREKLTPAEATDLSARRGDDHGGPN